MIDFSGYEICNRGGSEGEGGGGGGAVKVDWVASQHPTPNQPLDPQKIGNKRIRIENKDDCTVSGVKIVDSFREVKCKILANIPIQKTCKNNNIK